VETPKPQEKAGRRVRGEARSKSSQGRVMCETVSKSKCALMRQVLRQTEVSLYLSQAKLSFLGQLDAAPGMVR
jgi:hypothetical protein